MFTVKLEYSRKLMANHGPEIIAEVTAMASALPRALASAIRARVQGRGDLAGRAFPGWSKSPAQQTGLKLTTDVSAKYPDKATGVLGRGGAEWFEDGETYHRLNGTRRGSYSTTGGMWSGLSVVVWSPTASDILFRGRSDGQDPRYVRGKHGPVSKPLKINNALKAATVLRDHGINVLALSGDELVRLNVGVQTAMVRAIADTMGARFNEQQLSVGLPLDEVFRQALGVDAGAVF